MSLRVGQPWAVPTTRQSVSAWIEARMVPIGSTGQRGHGEGNGLSIRSPATSADCQVSGPSDTARTGSVRGAADLSSGLQVRPPGHFYSPMPSQDDVNRDAVRLFGPPSRTIPGIELNEVRQLALLEKLKDTIAICRFRFTNLTAVDTFTKKPLVWVL